MLVTVLAATPSRKEEHNRGSEEMVLAATPSRKEKHKCTAFQQAQHAISNPSPPQAGKGTGTWDRGSMKCSKFLSHFIFTKFTLITKGRHWRFGTALSHPIPQSKSSTGKVAVTGDRERALGLTALQR